MSFLAKMAPVFERQQGFISTRQAKASGYSNALLTHLVKQGELNRVARGIYRRASTPECREELAFIATLWSSGECVLSHRSALAAAGALPWEREWVEVSVAPSSAFRPRTTPTGVLLRREAIPDGHIVDVGFLRACSAPWALAQCVRDNLGTAFVQDLLPRCFELPDWSDDGFLRIAGGMMSGGQVDDLADLVEAARRKRFLPEGVDHQQAVPTRPVHRRALDARTNLAQESSPFVGRVDDIRRLEELHAEGHRLITILGSGGLGKTRLAVRFANRVLGARAQESVWYVSLAEARTGPDVCAAVGHALHTPMQGEKPAEDQLAFAIGDLGPALLILDNVEHVVDAAAWLLNQWFDDAPECVFLVTSRHRLDLRREVLLNLKPLRYGPDWRALDGPSEAAQLFLQQTRSVRSDYQPDPSELANIEAIVDQLDGIPLAIELAAARMAVLTSDEVLQRLSQRFELLTTTSRDRPARHGTVRQTIDWSWELLSEQEREVLSLLAVFDGGFTLAAAEHVAQVERAGSVLDLIQALVGKSMVHRAHARVAAPTRFFLYESVREYALERLGEAGERSAAESRHSDYFLHHAPWSEAGQRLVGDTRAVSQLAAERRNLEAIYRRALESGRPDDAARSALVLSVVYNALGPLEEAVGRIEAVLDFHAVLDPVLESRLLVALGGIKRVTGGTRLEHLQRALSLARESSDRRLEGLALAMMARVLNLLSRRTEAWEHSELALATVPEDDVLAVVRHVRGLILASQGKAAEAEAEYGQALVLYRAANDLAGEGELLTNLAVLHSWNSRPDDARGSLARALEISRQTGQVSLQARTHSYLGLACLRLGALRQGLVNLAEAERLHRALGNRFGEAFVLQITGRLEIVLGRFDEARTHEQEATHIFSELAVPRSEIVCLIDLAHCDTVQDRFEEARHKLDRAWTLTTEVEDLTVRGGIQIYRALLAAHEHQADVARDAWAEAIETLTGHALEDNEFLDALPIMRAALETRVALSQEASGDPAGAERLREQAMGRVWELVRPGDPSPQYPWGRPSRVQQSFSSRAAFQLLWAALPDGWRARVDLIRANPANEALVVDGAGAWFQPPGAPRADLSQRPTLRRILAVLGERRRGQPGEGVPHDDLLAAGWPDESPVYESGINRVYGAINTLRNEGLRDILVAAEEGYMLTPTVPMITTTSRPTD